MSGAPLSSNQTVLFGLGDLEAFQTALQLTSAPLMAHASRKSLRVRRAPRRRGGLYSKIGEQHCIRQLSNLLHQAAEARVSRLSHALGVRIDVGIR